MSTAVLPPVLVDHEGHPINASGRRICGAKTRAGTPCAQVAGHRTDHVGQGRCRLHGGLNPVKHGRYSTLTRVRIRDLITEHAADPAPLDTLPELAAARALFQDFLERYDAWREALLAWHADWQLRNALAPEKAEALRRVIGAYEADVAERGEQTTGVTDDLAAAREVVDALEAPLEGKPRMVLDVADAYRIVSEITKIVERIEKTRAANALSYEQLKRFLFALDRVLEARIPDAALLQRIRDDVLGIGV